MIELKLDTETWKVIPGYSNYKISNLGKIKSIPHKRKNSYDRFANKEVIMRTKLSGGYKQVELIDDNNNHKLLYVHRLVAITFIPNPNNYPCVNHKDENKVNNNVENLEWCSVSYNNKYGDRAKKVGEKIRRYVYLYEVKNDNLLFLDTFYISDCFKYNISIGQIYYYIDTNRAFKSKDNKHFYKLYSKAI